MNYWNIIITNGVFILNVVTIIISFTGTAFSIVLSCMKYSGEKGISNKLILLVLAITILSIIINIFLPNPEQLKQLL